MESTENKKDQSELLVFRDKDGVIRVYNTATITPEEIAIETVGIILKAYNDMRSDGHDVAPTIKDWDINCAKCDFVRKLLREILDNDVNLETLKELVGEF